MNTEPLTNRQKKDLVACAMLYILAMVVVGLWLFRTDDPRALHGLAFFTGLGLSAQITALLTLKYP